MVKLACLLKLVLTELDELWEVRIVFFENLKSNLGSVGSFSFLDFSTSALSYCTNNKVAVNLAY
jgi:hypothetical protein